MKKLLLLALLCSTAAHAAIEVVSPETWTLYRGTSIVQPRVAYTSKAACQAAAPLDVQHRCVGTETFVRRADAPACPPQPAAESRTMQCASPTVGTWTQTRTYTSAPAPTCWTPTAWAPATAPAGACTTPPPPPPPPTGAALYFSPAGNNANPGTQTAPKRDLTGINLNTLAAGTSLLFQRGGEWAMTQVSIENPNTSAAAPLTFADYGTGALPLLRYASGAGFMLGGNFSNTTNDGGYVFRNLRIQGAPGADRGIWLVQNVRDVTIDGVHIDGWRVGIASNTAAPYGVVNVSVLNSRITNNVEHGWLGHVKSGLRIEGSHFEGNNPSGDGFWHAVYNGGGDNGVFRNNRFVRNSVGPDGRCSSGGLTLHGVHNNTLVEGNVFEQSAAASNCWQVSINAKYGTAEVFRGLVVRGNTIVNGGNAGFAIDAAPGAVIENNRVFRTITVLNSTGTPAAQRAVVVAPGGGSGDSPGGGEIVRGNVACFSTILPADAATAISTAGATDEGNRLLPTTDAACAR